ncbi:MAG: hypothetical protein HS104_16420 [Polyangiaceae bacterium]|nr:hypothetical protein [Polyangiaceae bacterium]MCL4754726.1 hypothetical protein [Myxococcales bacterium]
MRGGSGVGLLFVAGMALACGSEAEGVAKEQPKLPDAALVDAFNDGAGTADAGKDAGVPFAGPSSLSETGIFSDMQSRTLAPGVLAYDVRFPLWSDGAEKQRFVSVPSGTQVDTSYMDVWKFPIGTKAWKEFRVAGKLIETRFLWKQAEGVDGWLKVAYVWDEAGMDAYPKPDGVPDAAGTKHDVPSVEQCEQCHNGAGDVLIGVGAIQLSKEAGGGALTAFVSKGWLSQPPAAEFPVPGDGVVENTIGYLHGNCGHCHNDESFLAQKRALRLKLLTSAKTPEETPLYKTALGAPAFHDLYGTQVIVTPGAPQTSQLHQRMKVRNLDQMPPLGTELADAAALAIIAEWITGLPP